PAEAGTRTRRESLLRFAARASGPRRKHRESDRSLASCTGHPRPIEDRVLCRLSDRQNRSIELKEIVDYGVIGFAHRFDKNLWRPGTREWQAIRRPNFDRARSRWISAVDP